jgi:excisionase family DNA binding protein
MAAADEITYTLREVAAMTHYPLRTLQRGCRAGRIDHTKLGRERVMTQAQVDALLEQHRKPAVVDDEQAAKAADVQRALARLQRGAA